MKCEGLGWQVHGCTCKSGAYATDLDNTFCVGAPERVPMIDPEIITVVNPAPALAPEATPNVKASGRVTAATVRPAKKIAEEIRGTTALELLYAQLNDIKAMRHGLDRLALKRGGLALRYGPSHPSRRPKVFLQPPP